MSLSNTVRACMPSLHGMLCHAACGMGNGDYFVLHSQGGSLDILCDVANSYKGQLRQPQQPIQLAV